MSFNAAVEKQGTNPEEPRLAFRPKPPVKPEDLDIPQSIAEDLMLRFLYNKGTSSLRGLSRALKLSFRNLCLEAGVGELRACYPADVTDILLPISAFEGTPAEVTPASLTRAASMYFARTKDWLLTT